MANNHYRRATRALLRVFIFGVAFLCRVALPNVRLRGVAFRLFSVVMLPCGHGALRHMLPVRLAFSLFALIDTACVWRRLYA